MIKYAKMIYWDEKELIDGFLCKYPQLRAEEYVIQEKIDGSNVSFHFCPFLPMTICKRNSVLKEDEDHYDMRAILYKYEKLFKMLQESVDTTLCDIQIYGELFGPKIQKRVNYGEETRIKFFDIRIDAIMKSPKWLKDFFEEHEFTDWLVPYFTKEYSLEEALAIDPTGVSTSLNTVDENELEGIVIKPYNRIYYDNHQIFYLRRKNKKFIERPINKPPKEKIIREDYVHELHDAFLKYINENRILSIFSKEGVIKYKSDIGKYIGLIIVDARNDFCKSYDIMNIGKRDQKYIFNAANVIKGFLEKALKSNI